MSAEAKVWQGPSGWWYGVHDGDCSKRAVHEGTPFELPELLTSISDCLGCPLRWTLTQYQSGDLGLRGFRC